MSDELRMARERMRQDNAERASRPLGVSRDASTNHGTIGRLGRTDHHDDDGNGRTDRDVPRSDDGTLNVYTRADMVRDNARRGLGPLQISKGR